MKIRDLKLRLKALLNRKRAEIDLDEELRFHLEMEARKYVAKGMPESEARFAALKAFGGVSQKQEECRDARGISLIETSVHDLRHAFAFSARVPVSP